MTTHELKLDIRYFDDVKSGKKNFEIRKNDRDFKVGDVLIMRKVSWFSKIFIPMRYAIAIMTNKRQSYLDEADNPCFEKGADTITAKIVELENHESLSELGYYNRLDFLEIDPSAVLKVLKEYFGTDKLPDNYVLLGIEVEK